MTQRQNKKRFVSGALASLHEVAEDLHAVGALSSEAMEKFDRSCLKPGKSERAGIRNKKKARADRP